LTPASKVPSSIVHQNRNKRNRRSLAEGKNLYRLQLQQSLHQSGWFQLYKIQNSTIPRVLYRLVQMFSHSWMRYHFHHYLKVILVQCFRIIILHWKTPICAMTLGIALFNGNQIQYRQLTSQLEVLSTQRMTNLRLKCAIYGGRNHPLIIRAWTTRIRNRTHSCSSHPN
jgi:hypothetical protein